MTQNKAEDAPNVITSTLLICDTLAYALLDTRAMNSFVSSTFMSKLNRMLNPFLVELVIYTLFGDAMFLDEVLRDCKCHTPSQTTSSLDLRDGVRPTYTIFYSTIYVDPNL